MVSAPVHSKCQAQAGLRHARDTSSGKHSHFRFASQVVFEALHNLEPRGYVVGWIIAISLLVGILIFLLLAVLLWKVSLATAGPHELLT